MRVPLVVVVALVAALAARAQNPCQFTGGTGVVYDLTPLRGTTYVVPNLAYPTFDEYIGVCGDVVTGVPQCATNAAVCELNKQTLAGTTVGFNPVTIQELSPGATLSMTYTKGDDGVRQAVMMFYCDPTGAVGSPEFMTEGTTTMTFRWVTRYACAGQVPTNPPTTAPTSPPTSSPVVADRGSCQPVGSLGSGRAMQTATLLSDGSVLVVGGYALINGEQIGQVTCEVLDATSHQWSLTGSPSIPRITHTATLLSTGEVAIVGGITGSSTNDTLVALTEIYSPTTRSWRTSGSLAVARNMHAAVVFEGALLAIGGTGAMAPLKSVERFDIASGTWSSFAPLLIARAYHTAAVLNDGTILVAGGMQSGSASITSERYVGGVWTESGPLNYPRLLHRMALLDDGRVLVVGGMSINGQGFLASCEIYDPDTSSWQLINPLHQGRIYFGLSRIGNTFIVTGGQAPQDAANKMVTLASIEVLDVSAIETGTSALAWVVNQGSLGASRYLHSAITLQDGQTVLIAAGEQCSGDSCATISSAELFTVSNASGPSIGLIVGVSLGALALVVLAVGGLMWVCRRKETQGGLEVQPLVKFSINDSQPYAV